MLFSFLYLWIIKDYWDEMNRIVRSVLEISLLTTYTPIGIIYPRPSVLFGEREKRRPAHREARCVPATAGAGARLLKARLWPEAASGQALEGGSAAF